MHKLQHAYGRLLFQASLTFSPVSGALPPSYITNEVKKIHQRFATEFLPRFRAQENLIHVLIGTYAYKNAFDLQVPAAFTTQDLLVLLKELLHLPDPLTTMSTSGERTFVTYYLCLGEQEIPFYQKLGDLQTGDRPLFTVLRITARLSSKGIETSGSYEGAVTKPVSKSKLRLNALEKLAVEQYTRQIEVAFDEAAKRLRQN